MGQRLSSCLPSHKQCIGQNAIARGRATASFFSEKKQGMAKAVLLYHSHQVFPGVLLPDDILKRHAAKIGVKNKPFAGQRTV